MGKKKFRGRPSPNANGRPRRRRRGNASRRPDVVELENPAEASDIPSEPGLGLLEMHPNGYGFLRSPENNYSRSGPIPSFPAR